MKPSPMLPMLCTLPGIFEAQREWHQARNEGLRGRPTEKDRREIDRIHGFIE